MLKIDGYDEALIGIAEQCTGIKLLAYDYLKLIKITQDNSKSRMSYEDAMEYVDFNIVGAYMGEGTPLIVYTYTMEEVEEIIEEDEE
jgi:hypothetical protein